MGSGWQGDAGGPEAAVAFNHVDGLVLPGGEIAHEHHAGGAGGGDGEELRFWLDGFVLFSSHNRSVG